MVSSMGPNEWDCSITCFAKLDMLDEQLTWKTELKDVLNKIHGAL